MASITAVVVIAVLAGTLIPVLDDATATTDTLTNDGYYRMSDTEDETVITWAPSVSKTTLTVDDVEISMAGLPTGTYSIAFSDDFIIRYSNEGTYNVQLWASSYVAGMSGTSAATLTITINSTGGTFAISGGSTTNITHSGEYFIIDPDGDKVMKYKDKSAYLLSDSSVVYAGGTSVIVGTTYSGIYFEGTVDNLTFTPMSSSVTISDVDSVYTESDDHVGVILLEKVTFKTTHTSGDVQTDKDQTYSYFLVPYQITAERTVHFTDGENAIFNAIPVIVIVALLLGIVALVLRSRMD